MQVLEEVVIFPGPHVNPAPLPRHPLPLLLALPELPPVVVPAEHRQPALPVRLLPPETALVLHPLLCDFALAFSEALAEVALVSGAVPPGVGALSLGLALAEGALEEVPVGEKLLALAVLEEVLEVALVLLPCSA